MTFGERIKMLREERGLSQGQLAEKLNVHQSHISRIEIGIHEAQFQTAIKLAEALGVSVADLVPDEREVEPS